MSTALADLRVVELGGNVSAPYCGKLLADLGADVVKVEPPGEGDPLRQEGTFPEDDVDPSRGGLFRYLNTNKRSMSCDPGSEPGRQLFESILRDADLLIENLGAGALEAIGLGSDRIAQINPGLAVIRISDFGQSGPYAAVPATDLTVQATANWINNHHIPGQEPVQVGGRLADFVAGVYAATAALTAVSMKASSGKPVSFDVAKQECLVSCLGATWLHLETLQSLGWGAPDERYFPFPGVVPCKDGLVSVNSLTQQHFSDFCNLSGVPGYIPLLMEIAYGGPNFDAFFRDIEPWLMERTVEEVVEICQAVRIPAVPISNGKTIRDLPQLRARSFFVKDPETGTDFPGFPYRFELTPPTLRRSAPRPGDEVPVQGRSIWEARRRPVSDMNDNREGLPFAGLRVLDLGIFWAGPYVSCYLGAYGADVIKIESIQRPDAFRYQTAYPEEGPDWYERSSIWQHTNLNKRDVTLNLDDPAGQQIFARLVAGADVLIENFSPRVMENFGFGAKRLRAMNPRLIVLRMPGFGLEGPWRNYSSFAMPLEQVSGMAWVTGETQGPPLNVGGYADALVGAHGLVAVQAALRYRARTGKGQLLEVAQLEVGVSVTAEQLLAYSMTGKLMGRHGNRSAAMAPQGVYRCGDAGFVAISIRDDEDWKRFAAIESVRIWAEEPRFASQAMRRQQHDELDALLSRWVNDSTADEVIGTLRKSGIPSAILVKHAEIAAEPNLVARGYFQEIDHPLCGVRRFPRWPWRHADGGVPAHRFRAPTLGEHNHDVLEGELGLFVDEMGYLSSRGVIGTIPRGLD